LDTIAQNDQREDKMRHPAIFGAVIAALISGSAVAETSVKIGVLGDRSGPYSDLGGEGSVVAARMAVEDFRSNDRSLKVDLLSADHQNKPDIGASIARQWYDQDGVDMIIDVPTSSVAFAVHDLTKDKNKTLIITGVRILPDRAAPPIPSTGSTTRCHSPTEQAAR
jgi:branched-chain amino acid transport system substrate-binding protein